MKFRWLLILLLAAGAAAALWHFLPRKEKEKAPAGPRSVPVTLHTVAQQDVEIWLTGLGSVQGYQKVTVRPRVGGALEEIAFREGTTVREGDVLAKIDSRPYQSALAQATAKQAQSTALLGNARIALERVTKLIESGAESRQRYDELDAAVAQAVAQEQADAAATQAAALDLEFTTIKAPISGRTGIRLIDKGNLVTAGQDGGLVVITQLQPISVVFTLPQQELPAIRMRMAADKTPLAVQALNDEGKTLAEGKLELVDNEIDAASGTVRLKATFSNENEALWPGQFVSARVLVETRKQAVSVPTQTIQAGLDGPFAYVVKEGKVEPRLLVTGPQVAGATVIEKGLNAGEEIVLDGQNKLQPGAAISAQPAKP